MIQKGKRQCRNTDRKFDIPLTYKQNRAKKKKKP